MAIEKKKEDLLKRDKVGLSNSGPNAGKYLAMYAAQITANSDAESLRLTIKSVILIADRMEKSVTGADDY